jgi:hypothetical protein
MRVSPGRPRREHEYFGFTNDKDAGVTRRTGGFYEPHLENAQED